MPRYTDVDALLNELPDDLPYKASVKRVLIQAPDADVAPKSEVAALKIELEAMRTAANAYKMHYEKAKSEVERLHGILLQFTDIVHKWGAKNNIDTSEISLVPILQEEADSIIKKANQGVAREIIDDFDEELHKFAERYYEQGKIEYFTLCEVIYQLVIAKIKKKYTEEKV